MFSPSHTLDFKDSPAQKEPEPLHFDGNSVVPDQKLAAYTDAINELLLTSRFLLGSIYLIV